MRIIFVRHGHPNYAENCLTELGKVQAAAAAEALKNEPITAAYSSPFGRAKETCDYIVEGRNLDIRILDFMRELNWNYYVIRQYQFKRKQQKLST